VQTDVLELKRQYESLTDDEIMRVWADQEGLAEIAAAVLKEEITKRGLVGPQFEGRTAELKQELRDNQRRLERHQKRVVSRILMVVALIGISFLIALAKLLMK
jgi:hypothetical protein